MLPVQSNGAVHPSRLTATEAAVQPPASDLSPGPLPFNPQLAPPDPQSTPSLPPLSDSDEKLLETYIELNFNLDRLAEYSQLPTLRLIRWLNQPHIQHY